MKNIEDLIDTFENTGDNGEFFIGDYSNVEIAIYIRQQKEEIERLHSIIKALHNYFTKHEQYEDNEFLRQLESCTEKDKEWLEKMGGKYE